MRHRGTDVGRFFFAEKAEGETFTDEDEEVLTLFASQAALAIANARAHRDERCARADLEALVETSPVGVAVFDARSGRAVSLNREARRIADSLRTPGHPPEQLLEVMSFRRANGREESLREFPIGRHLLSGEILRAEEVVLSVPDGRTVRTLINVTPIRAEEREVVGSVVVTVQDLAPLEEIERLRTEFLGLVGHELRAPLAAIKGSAATLLEEEAIDRAEMREFHRIIAEQADHMRGLIGDLLDAGRIDSGTLSVAPEPAEVAELVERAAVGRGTTVTFTLPASGDAGRPKAAGQQGEPARILVVDDDPRMLRSVRDALSAAGYAPLVTGEPDKLPHLLRAEKPQLVLLDLLLPGGDGIELMGRVPELTDVPVIFISAYGRDETIARALEAGAADYLVKPFSPTELVARVRAALCRHDAPAPFVVGDLAIDYGRRLVTVSGEAVALTSTEYELLCALSLAAGRVVSYATLLRRIWKEREDTEVNLVRIFAGKLRRKLGDSATDPVWIFNVRGVGYRVAAPGEA